MRGMYVNAVLYNIFVKGREDARGMDAVDLNIPNIYVRDVVTVFKLFCWGSPPNKKKFALPPRCYTGAAQPYTRLCVCFSSLLIQFK